MSLIHIFIDLVVILLFIISFYVAYKIMKIDFLLLSTLFALIFENLHVYFFKGMEGGYYYSTEFLMLYNVPVFVILSWGVLLFTSYILISKLTSSKYERIFLTPLFVLIIDLVIDFFAVKLSLWTWVGYSIMDGFFGIPAGNFIAWLIISFCFVLCYELINKWLVVVFSYILFIILMNIISIPKLFLNLSKSYESSYMFGVFIIYLLFYFIFYSYFYRRENCLNINGNYLILMYLCRLFYYLFSIILLISLWNQLSVMLIFVVFIFYLLEIIFAYFILKPSRSLRTF